jgi:hypothetical protein
VEAYSRVKQIEDRIVLQSKESRRPHIHRALKVVPVSECGELNSVGESERSARYIASLDIFQAA